MNTTTATTASKSLIYKTSKTVGSETIYVSIRLNDECKNGHQDFSITGDVYQAGQPKIDKYFLCGGCIHEEIEKHYPEFIPFIKLHLCDWEGIPMHAGANGFYHLNNEMGKAQPGTPEHKTYFCEYYRISPAQFDELCTSKNVLQYSVKLQTMEILKQWKEEAGEAIKLLEKLTGQTFEVDSPKSQFYPPTPEQLEEEEKKQREGYYTPEAEEQRKEEAKEILFTKWDNELKKECDILQTKVYIKKTLFNLGGDLFIDQALYHSHIDTLALNWRGYGKTLTPEQIQTIKDGLKSIKGLQFTEKG